MRSKKLVSIALIVTLAISSFAGCAKKTEPNSTETNTTPSGTESDASNQGSTEVVTLSFFDKNSGSNTFDDPIAKAIMEKTGVKIEVQNPTGNPMEKLNLMLTAQNYPDIVLMERGNEIVNKYIEAGALVDLTNLIEKSGPNVKEMYGDTLDKIKYKDGKNYYLSNWYGTDPDAAAGVLMRYDILCELVGQERADSNEPFTQEEFVAILKQFKEKYPTIDGKDSIAVTLNAESENGLGNFAGTLKGMFGLKTFAQTESGLSHIATADKFKDAISFMNQLYTEGLLDKEWVVNKKNHWIQKLSAGNVFCTFGSYWDTDPANTSLKTNVSENAIFKSYKVVGKGLTADQTTYSGRSTLGWDAIAITKNCKNPEAAMKLIDFLVSEEGQYLMMWGQEGNSWNLENGVHVPTQEILDQFTSDFDNTKLTTGIRKWTWFIKNGNGTDGTPYDMASKYKLSDVAAFANKSFGESDRWDTAEFDGLTPDASTMEGLEWQKIQDLYRQEFPKIVNASSNEEALSMLDSLVTYMNAAGLEDVFKVINQNHQDRIKLWSLDK